MSYAPKPPVFIAGIRVLIEKESAFTQFCHQERTFQPALSKSYAAGWNLRATPFMQ
jgi:hypothetical protein